MIESRLIKMKATLEILAEELLELRVKIPLTARNSHSQIRNVEQYVSYSIDYLGNTLNSVKNECPTVLSIENKREVVDDLPY